MFLRIIGIFVFYIRRFNNYCLKKYLTCKFSSVGKNVYIGNNGIFTYRNIEIGNDVSIGANAVFQSSFGKIVIGDHVMFGPGVHIHGGNHKINEVGKLLNTLPKNNRVMTERCLLRRTAGLEQMQLFCPMSQ